MMLKETNVHINMSTDQFGNIKHRNGLSKCFITFPQSGGVCTKEDLLQFMESAFCIVKYIIVEEPHEGLGVHLHGMFTFSKKPTKPQLLHAFKTKFPNDFKRIDVQSVKSEKAAIQYLVDPIKNKEIDLKPLTNFAAPSGQCEAAHRSHKNYMFQNNDDDTNEMFYYFSRQHFLNYDCEKCAMFIKQHAAKISETSENVDPDFIELT